MTSGREIGGYITAASGQELGKHVPAAKNTHATIEELCFLCGPCREVITRTASAMSQLSRVEAGSNTSTVKNTVASPTGLGPENYCAGEVQQQL
jgi:hypothetical protein